MTMLAELVDVVIGVDTHKHTHTAAAVSRHGAVLEHVTVTADPAGYVELVEFADRHAGVRVWAIEGTGSYGAGLARHLHDRDEVVVEAERPARPKRRHGAKSDEIDAIRAAREALGRTDLATPRSDRERQAVAIRLAARRSAVDASTDTQRQLHALVITAPEPLRQRLRAMTTTQLIATCTRLRSHATHDTTTAHTIAVLRTLARRVQALSTEAADHERAIKALIRAWRPDMLEPTGVGPINAAVVLCAWSHPGRIRSEAAFAMLAGTAPIPASSGQTNKHRLNRSGDRQLNRALHTIVLCRLRHDPTTHAYLERRRAQGHTDREIRRCLKRYITRQLYRQLEHPPT